MHPTRVSPAPRLLSASALLLAALGASTANAADITWNNAAGGNWNTASNWNPNTVPLEVDAHAVFFGDNSGAFTSPVTVTLDASTLGAASLSFSGSANYTVASSSINANFLRMAGFNQQITSGGTGAHQITARTNVGSRFGNATFTATNNSSGTLTFADTIRVLGDSVSRVHTLNFGGTGDISVQAIANAGSQTYTSTIVKSGTGTLIFRSTTLTGTTNGIRVDGGRVSFNFTTGVDFNTVIGGDGGVVHSQGSRVTLSGANSYKGGTRIEGASRVLAITSDGNLGDAAGGVTFGAGSGVLRVDGTGNFSTARNITSSEAGSGAILGLGGAAGRTATFNGNFSGAGNIVFGTSAGLGGFSGSYVFSGAGTHTGDTQVFSSVDGANRASFQLADTGSLSFKIGASGVNNKVSGVPGGGVGANAPTATFAGTFNFDLTGASASPGSSWTVVDFSTLNPLTSFASTFQVAGFTQANDVWSNGVYQFSEATGILSVAAIPEPSSTAVLAGGLALAGVALRRRRR